MPDTQEPNNRLELQLAEAQQGKTPLRTFLDTLVRSEVYILLREEPERIVQPHDLNPLLVRGGDEQLMLAVFTSERRATEADADIEAHRHPYRVRLESVLKGLQRGIGLVVNPGWKLGFEIQPDDVRHMLDELHIR